MAKSSFDRITNSWLYRACKVVGDVVVISALFLLFCLPVVTIGSSVTALYYTVYRKYHKKIDKITNKLYRNLIKEIGSFTQDYVKVPYFKKHVAVRRGKEKNWRFYYQVSYVFLPTNRRDEIESILIIYNEKEMMITSSYIQLSTTNRDQSVEGMQIMWGNLSPKDASWNSL